MFRTLRTALYKNKVARTARELMESFGDTAWLEVGRRQLASKTPAQADLWRDVAAVIVIKVRAARDAATP